MIKLSYKRFIGKIETIKWKGKQRNQKVIYNGNNENIDNGR